MESALKCLPKRLADDSYLPGRVCSFLPLRNLTSANADGASQRVREDGG
jgi:hypothetical protein